MCLSACYYCSILTTHLLLNDKSGGNCLLQKLKTNKGSNIIVILLLWGRNLSISKKLNSMYMCIISWILFVIVNSLCIRPWLSSECVNLPPFGKRIARILLILVYSLCNIPHIITADWWGTGVHLRCAVGMWWSIQPRHRTIPCELAIISCWKLHKPYIDNSKILSSVFWLDKNTTFGVILVAFPTFQLSLGIFKL